MNDLDDERELERFARKASSYREALELCPSARRLERNICLGLLKRIDEKGDKSRKIYGDLMAGEGYLTRAIHDQIGTAYGYEASRAMVAGSRFFRDIPLIRSDRLAELATRAGKEADIVVSLAGWHHILNRGSNGVVDRCRSLERQLSIVDRVLGPASRAQYLLIADVPIEPSQIGLADEAKDIVVGEVPGLGMSSIAELDAFLNAELFQGQRRPAPARWFREVVDTKGEVGHADAFLDAKFLRELALRGYSTQASCIACPWVFPSLTVMEDFVRSKFLLFDLNSVRLLELVREHLGIATVGTELVMGWNLWFIMIWRHQ